MVIFHSYVSLPEGKRLPEGIQVPPSDAELVRLIPGKLRGLSEAFMNAAPGGAG
jgi:hypothetical protein